MARKNPSSTRKAQLERSRRRLQVRAAIENDKDKVVMIRQRIAANRRKLKEM